MSVLGQEKDAQYYRKLSWETSEAYRELLMEADCTVKKEFQTAYVLPLYYQMLSKEDKKKTAANLARLVKKDGYHITTGFPGTPYVLFALSGRGGMHFGKTVPATPGKMTEPEVWFPSIIMQVVQWETFCIAGLPELNRQREDTVPSGSSRL